MKFKEELWKDQRKLDTTDIGGKHCLIKQFLTVEEAEREHNLINRLSQTSEVANLPKMLRADRNEVIFEYIRGIRVFNLLVELDRLDEPYYNIGREIKNRIIDRCEQGQRDLQKSLINLSGDMENRIYPAGDKIRAIISILSDALGIVVNMKKIDEELEFIDKIWIPFSTVPFRDATTKNIVLASSKLWLGAFDCEESRRKYLIETLEKGMESEWLSADLIDFDFSSCIELSTPEDDPVSLRFHERTWIGPPVNLDVLGWNFKVDKKRLAVTYLVRYYRFGGRKAAYRILHPWGHRIRFRHDNDAFYFQRLPAIIIKLWPNAVKRIPNLLEFTDTVGRALYGGRPEIDYFIAEGLAEKRRYYCDMYPE